MDEQRAVSEAQKRAHRKYMEKFVEIKVRMTPDRRTIIQEYAQTAGESVTAFINRAIDGQMDRDSAPQEAAEQAPEAPQDGALVLIPLGQVSVGRGDMRTMYTDKDTERQYYVEPVISDDEWDDLQKAKEVSTDDPGGLPF